MQLTWLDSNSWLIEIAGKRILLDPWLVGNLVFGNLSWLIKGVKNTQRPIPEHIDIILLSQGIEDHAHPETLKHLDHNIPVVASPAAAKVVKDLGYQQITALKHGEIFTLADNLQIEAVPGSPLGPQLVENGYILRELNTGYSLYYEPHGYHSPSLKEKTPIDVIITPIINLKIPLLGNVIKGQKNALEVCQWLKPQVILNTAAGGDITFEGLLINLLRAEGSVEDFQNLLAEKQLSTQALEITPGKPFTPELKQRVTLNPT